jgi:hypothetical protein
MIDSTEMESPSPSEGREDRNGGAREGLARLVWPGLLLATSVVPFATVILGRHTLARRDTALIHLPLRSLVTEALRDWRLPLWNPHEGMGKPLLADAIHGVLHPLSLLAAAIDPGGTDLLSVLYVLSAAVGAWVLARELGLSGPAAYVAGAAYALSGYVLSMTGALVFLAGASCIPWQVAALAACGRGERYAVPLAAAATAIGVFSGDAQMVVVGAILGAALAVERGGWRSLLRVASGTALGAAVSGVQLIPSAAHLLRDARAGGVTGFDLRMWALSPLRLAELVSPGLMYRMPNDASAEVFEWLDGGGKYLPFGASVFVGVPALALVAVAPFRERRVRVLAVAAVVLLWLALGHHAGATSVTSHVPVWRSFRYTEKLVVPLTLAIALLAAHGLAGRSGAGPPVRRLGIALGLGALVAPLLWLGAAWGRGTAANALALKENVAAGMPVALGGAALAAAALLARRAALRDGLLALAVGASLVAAIPFACHFGDPAAIRNSPLAGAPVPPPGVRLGIPSYGIPSSDAPDFDALDATNSTQSTLGVPCWSVRDRLDVFDSYGPFTPTRFGLLPVRFGDTAPLLFRHFAGTHVVLQAPSYGGDRMQDRWVAGGQLVYRDPASMLWIYAVPHRPWVRFARATNLAASPEAARDRLLANLSSQRDEVVVEADAPVPAGTGAVTGLHRGREEIALEVEAASDALLVVGDAYWTGWKAWIDGSPTRVLPADVLARGVVVPAGRHRVAMRYEPEEVRWGKALTALGLLATLSLTAFLALRRATPATCHG